jgi:guanine nucleotide-binding protein G(s) subunit alpha
MSFVQENKLLDIEELSEAVERLSRMPNFPQEATSSDMRYAEKLVQERADDIKLLWECEPIQTTYKRRNEFQIVECAQYFLSKVHEVMHPDYVPTDDDILQIQIQTTDITENMYQMKAGIKNCKLIMVGIKIS